MGRPTPVRPVAGARASSPAALGALRHPLFRRYSVGVMLSLIGNWVEAAAFGYVVLLLGGSAADLGLIGFLNTIPNLILGLPAGALADRYDRKKLLLLFQGLNMGVAGLLGVVLGPHPPPLPPLGGGALGGGGPGAPGVPPLPGVLGATPPPPGP